MDKGKLVIFDMDGVLVDVTGSYREVVRKTVNLYLKEILGISIKKENWLTLSEIDLIKRSGGLNNDWDLTYTILNTILTSYFDSDNRAYIKAFLEIGREAGKDADKDVNTNNLVHLIEDYRGKFKRGRIEKAIDNINLSKIFNPKNFKENISPFLIYKGDVTTGNLVKRIFQEIYLGKSLFYDIYKEEAIYCKGDGLIEKEYLIPDIGVIKKLSDLALLSIATGRPKIEALYALQRFKIKDFFYPVVTEDDIEAAEMKTSQSLRKPNPFIINECISRLNFKERRNAYYVGDMPDDMEAAVMAKVQPIGFIYRNNRGNGSEVDIKNHISILKDRGAEVVVFNFDDLIKVVS